MSTRANITIEYGESRVILYRHCDGYPSETGADILAAMEAGDSAQSERKTTGLRRLHTNSAGGLKAALRGAGGSSTKSRGSSTWSTASEPKRTSE